MPLVQDTPGGLQFTDNYITIDLDVKPGDMVAFIEPEKPT